MYFVEQYTIKKKNKESHRVQIDDSVSGKQHFSLAVCYHPDIFNEYLSEKCWDEWSQRW